MKATGRPIAAALRSRRLYSAQATSQKPDAAPRQPLPRNDPKISRCGNGAVVVSYENYAPVSKIGIYFNSGPRFETGNDIGISHFIRNAANLSTTKSTAFGISRNVQQIGGNLIASTTREHNIFVLECMRDKLEVGVEFLGHVATCPAFKPWEIELANQRLRLDLANLEAQPEIQLVEALHKAAYRTTLGNSLFMDPHKIGSFTPEQLHDFTKRYHIGTNIALVGLGVDHDHFMDLAEQQLTISRLPGNKAPEPTAVKYYGGQERINTLNPMVHAAIVTEGANLDHWDFMTIGVLQKILGTGPRLKYSENLAGSKLAQVASKQTTFPTAVACVNANYANSGLFGFHVVGHYTDMDKILKGVLKEYASASTEGAISEAELKRGIALFKGTMHLELESNQGLLEAFGKQAAIAGELFNPPKEVDLTADKVTLEDIRNVAQKLAEGKYTMAAVGNLSHTPQLEDLLEVLHPSE